MRFLSVSHPLRDCALAVFVPTLARFTWHWEAGPRIGGGGPLAALGFGCSGRGFSAAHGELFRLEARQVKSSPACVCMPHGSREIGGGRGPRLTLPRCRDRPARGARCLGSAPAPAPAPDLTTFLPLSPSSRRRFGSDGGAGPAAVPLRHRDQPGAG